MQKMTLLEMVQNIASALETDEINSVTDTTESLQIAEVIKETFYDQFTNINIPEHFRIFQLENVADLNRPNYLRIPENINKVDWVKYYDYRMSQYGRALKYMDPQEFFERQLEYYIGPDTFLTEVTDASGIVYYVPNNCPPQYFTILEDKYLVFDSYDSEFEDTLNGVRTICYGRQDFEFLMEDDFVPPLDANLFPLLLAESKAVCFINLKQVASNKEEQRARRHRIRMQRNQWRSRQAQNDWISSDRNYARNR